MNQQLWTGLILGGVVGCGLLGVFLFYWRKERIRVQSLRQQEMAEGQLRYEQSLMHSHLEMQEAIMRKISQEIHDNVGQVLSLAKLNITMVHSGNKAVEELIITEELLTKAINDLRDLSRSLHGERVRQLGLTEALKHELNILSRSTGISVQFIYHGEELMLNDEQVVVAFRMVQEALSNVMRHARATELYCHVYRSGPYCHIHINDNGVGFRPEAVSPGTRGLGLLSMEQRASIVKGHVKIRSVPGQGTDVIIALHQNPL